MPICNRVSIVGTGSLSKNKQPLKQINTFYVFTLYYTNLLEIEKIPTKIQAGYLSKNA